MLTNSRSHIKSKLFALRYCYPARQRIFSPICCCIDPLYPLSTLSKVPILEDLLRYDGFDFLIFDFKRSPHSRRGFRPIAWGHERAEHLLWSFQACHLCLRQQFLRYFPLFALWVQSRECGCLHLDFWCISLCIRSKKCSSPKSKYCLILKHIEGKAGTHSHTQGKSFVLEYHFGNCQVQQRLCLPIFSCKLFLSEPKPAWLITIQGVNLKYQKLGFVKSPHSW